MDDVNKLKYFMEKMNQAMDKHYRQCLEFTRWYEQVYRR